MPRCRVDQSLKRVEVDGFAFPLGSYPVEELHPKPGYTLDFEPADGGEQESGEDWEEWPDRYVFDILVPSQRVEPLCRALFSIMPGRVYPILDVLGHDAYREVDPYVTYDLVGQDRVLDALRRFRSFFYEDGLVGFGAMSEEPFIYIFVDEHKMVTVRVEASLKPRVEKALQAFDLEQIEELRGADAVTHEHRGVLDAPPDRLDLLTAEEIIEGLRDDWGLVLNVDREGNTDDEGKDLGITGWRCVVRFVPRLVKPVAPAASDEAEAETGTGEAEREEEESPSGMLAGSVAAAGPAVYYEVLVTAGSLGDAEEQSVEAAGELWEKSFPEPERGGAAEKLAAAAGKPAVRAGEEAAGEDVAESPDDDDEAPAECVVVAADRMTMEDFAEAVRRAAGKDPNLQRERVWHVAVIQ